MGNKASLEGVFLLKAFISVDLEGMPYIVNVNQLNAGKPLYSEARRVATRVTHVIVEELYRLGFENIVIADSHGCRCRGFRCSVLPRLLC